MLGRRERRNTNFGSEDTAMVRLACVSTFVILGLGGPAASSGPVKNPVCPVTAPVSTRCAASWSSGNHFMIRGKSAGKEKRVEWRYEFAKNRDLKLGVRIASLGGAETGAVFLIDNRTMLTKGLTLTPGHEIDTLGVPILTLQLVADLLDRAFPAGPSAVYGRQPIDEADNTTPVRIAAQGATGFIPAPWRLTGAVERLSASRISFDLTLAFKPLLDDAELQLIQFAGIWEKQPAPPMLSDATKIDGWAIHRIIQIGDSDTGSAMDDFRATRVPNSFPTLGALRRHIAEDAPADDR